MLLGLLLLGALSVLPSSECTVSPGDLYQTVRIDTFGQSALLPCLGNFTFRYWLLPNLGTVGTGYMGGRVELLPGNNSLYLRRVESEDLGMYFCHGLSTAGLPEYTRTELYIYRPTLWQLYRWNTIVGASAAAVLLVLLGTTCLIYSYHYEGRRRSRSVVITEPDGEAAELGPKTGYPNDAYAVGGEYHPTPDTAPPPQNGSNNGSNNSTVEVELKPGEKTTAM